MTDTKKAKRVAALGSHLLKAKTWDIRINAKKELMAVVSFDVPSTELDEKGEPITVHKEKALTFGDAARVRTLETLRYLGYQGTSKEIGSLHEGKGGPLDAEVEVTVEMSAPRKFVNDRGVEIEVPAEPEIAWINSAGGIRMGGRVSKADVDAWSFRIGELIDADLGASPKKKPMPSGPATSPAAAADTSASVDDDNIPF